MIKLEKDKIESPHGKSHYFSAHSFTFSPFLFLLHLFAIFLQLLVCEFVKGVRTLLADDNLGLILLLDDGLGCGHELPLQDTQKVGREISDVTVAWTTCIGFNNVKTNYSVK